MELLWQKVQWTLGTLRANKLPHSIYRSIRERFPANQTVTYLKLPAKSRIVSTLVGLDKVRQRLEELESVFQGDLCLYRSPPGKPQPLTAKHLLPDEVIKRPPRRQLPFVDFSHIHAHLVGATAMRWANGHSNHPVAEQVVLEEKTAWIILGKKMDTKKLEEINCAVSRLSCAILRSNEEFRSAQQAAGECFKELEAQMTSKPRP